MIKPKSPNKTIQISESVDLFNTKAVFEFLTKHKDHLDKVTLEYYCSADYSNDYYDEGTASLETAEYNISFTKPNNKYEEELKQYNIDLEKYKIKTNKTTEKKVAAKQIVINKNLELNAKDLAQVNKQIDSLLNAKKKNPVKLAELNLDKVKLEVKKEKLESDLVLLDKELLSVKVTNGK